MMINAKKTKIIAVSEEGPEQISIMLANKTKY